MTKLGPQDAIEPIVKLSTDKPPSRLQAGTQILTLLSLLFVVMTPVTYFNGRAFHDGWYAYLHLDQQMFPLDTAGMLTQGAVAWGDALAELIDATFKSIGAHWFVVLLMIFSGALLWSVFAWLNRTMEEGGKKKERAAKTEGRLARLASPVFSRAIVLTLALFLAIEVVSLMTLGFAALSLPFYLLGRYEAKKAVSIDFAKNPLVTVKSAKGDILELRELGCGPQFCALWGNGHASTAPLSAISWSDSPPPDK
ncbi:hypothetical protein [Dyella sp. Tek66A03]|uniref:hypothetical protein n=1 Tax=Dyella sp. Tek66A03 TaxID=3458298 RepID=UPI00403E3FF5